MSCDNCANFRYGECERYCGGARYEAVTAVCAVCGKARSMDEIERFVEDEPDAPPVCIYCVDEMREREGEG